MLKKIIKEGTILFIGNLLFALFGIIFRYLAAADLSKEIYGKLALYISAWNVLIHIGYLDASEGLSKYVSQWEGDKKKFFFDIYKIILPFTLFGGIIISLFALSVYKNYLYGVYSFIGFFSVCFVYASLGYFRGIFRMAFSSLFYASVNFFRLLILFVLIGINFLNNSENYFIAYTLATIFPALIVYVFISSGEYKNTKGKVDSNKFDKFLFIKYSVFLSLSSLLFNMLNFLPRQILSWLHGYQEVAELDIAFLFYLVFQMFFINLGNALIPNIASSIKEKRFDILKFLRMCIPFFLGLILIPILLYPVNVPFFIFEKLRIEKYYHVIGYFKIMIFALPFHFLYQILASYIKAEGSTYLLFLVLLFSTFFSFFTGIFMIYKLSLLGGILTYIFSLIACSIGMMVVSFIVRTNKKE